MPLKSFAIGCIGEWPNQICPNFHADRYDCLKSCDSRYEPGSGNFLSVHCGNFADLGDGRESEILVHILRQRGSSNSDRPNNFKAEVWKRQENGARPSPYQKLANYENVRAEYNPGAPNEFLTFAAEGFMEIFSVRLGQKLQLPEGTLKALLPGHQTLTAHIE